MAGSAVVVSLLLGVVALLPPTEAGRVRVPGAAKPPPAWRALQVVPPELAKLGKLSGSPPCLATLQKVGSSYYRKAAAWRLGRLDIDGSMELDIHLQLDRNPDEPCCSLSFVDSTGARVGRVLLACEAEASALRGMEIREEMRGRGLAKYLVASWLHLCAIAELAPATRMINKPLLSLTLQRFGFAPTRSGSGVPVTVGGALTIGHTLGHRRVSRQGERAKRAADRNESVTAVTATQDVQEPSERPARQTHIRTEFAPPAESCTLDAAVASVLGTRSSLSLAASPNALRNALTLRGGAFATRAPPPPALLPAALQRRWRRAFGCESCGESRAVACPNCDAAGGYEAMGGVPVACRACRGTGRVICRACFTGDGYDLAGIRRTMGVPD